MKKVIFISALAIAAAVSCTKSDIVDTKFGNDVIGFESYIGRAAQTKAAVINDGNITEEVIGLYGFYTGTDPFAGDTSIPNLWDNKTLTHGDAGWTPDGTKYWTNSSDNYSFLAYAPYATGKTGNGLVASNGANPTVTYTVPATITSQKDVLYANPITDMKRGETDTPPTVGLTMKHALSRIAIKANEKHPDYSYTITALSLTGTFVKENTFSLVESKWATATGAEETYNFVVNNAVVDATNGGNAEADPVQFVDCTGADYLMVIPTTVTEAILTVKYKTTYGTEGNEVISAEIEKEVKISQTFEMGKAYTINLTFEPNSTEEIKFTVDVNLWDTVNKGENAEDPSDDFTEETPISGPVQS